MFMELTGFGQLFFCHRRHRLAQKKSVTVCVFCGNSFFNRSQNFSAQTLLVLSSRIHKVFPFLFSSLQI